MEWMKRKLLLPLAAWLALGGVGLLALPAARVQPGYTVSSEHLQEAGAAVPDALPGGWAAGPDPAGTAPALRRLGGRGATISVMSLKYLA